MPSSLRTSAIPTSAASCCRTCVATTTSNGWRWQMNLELLGDYLSEMGGWPELDAEPYDGPVLWVAGGESRYVQPEYAAAMRALFPRVSLITIKGRALGA